MLGETGLAQAVENGRKLGQISLVVAPRPPMGPGAGDREVRVERKARFDGGIRFVELTELREGDDQLKAS